MPHAVRTDSVVRLHTDAGGLIWFGGEGEPAENTCLDAYDFFEAEAYRDELDRARVVRLLGTRANATLVVKLQERKASSSLFNKKTVLLGSPAAVPAGWLKTDPAAVLHHLWQPSAAAVLADHWHEMTTDDYTTYAMINATTEKEVKEVPQVVRKIAAYHPAWPAVTFVASGDVDAACQLLCHVIDPRWYRHPRHPDRLTRLYAHLGVTPDNMAVIAGDSAARGLHFNRATLAVRTWYNRLMRRGSPTPRDFLAQTLEGVPLAEGLLRGTRRLVDFVARVWLDAVRPAHPEAGFRAEQFFRNPGVARAYEQHLSTARRV
jgi:hypothetical protein